MNASVVESKEIIETYCEALSGQSKPQDLIDRFVSDPVLQEHIRRTEAAFPKYKLIPDEIVAEGDLVAVRATVRGTHQGPFAGLEATGRKVSLSLMIFYQIEEGRIAKHWMEMDMMTLMKQLTD